MKKRDSGLETQFEFVLGVVSAFVTVAVGCIMYNIGSMQRGRAVRSVLRLGVGGRRRRIWRGVTRLPARRGVCVFEKGCLLVPIIG